MKGISSKPLLMSVKPAEMSPWTRKVLNLLVKDRITVPSRMAIETIYQYINMEEEIMFINIQRNNSFDWRWWWIQ